MKLVAKTDIGSQRSENQDSYRGGRRPDDAVWGAVCDGMGGARGGRLASTMAVDALQQAIEAGIDEAHTPQAGRALLESAVEQANRSVYEKARGTPSLSGMGTKIYSISELQPGDLVFFNDPSRNKGKACSHAGIYIGNGQHVHASSSRNGGVITSDLTSGYYNTYFVGGLRLS